VPPLVVLRVGFEPTLYGF